jgi:hypothetical protein
LKLFQEWEVRRMKKNVGEGKFKYNIFNIL